MTHNKRLSLSSHINGIDPFFSHLLLLDVESALSHLIPTIMGYVNSRATSEMMYQDEYPLVFFQDQKTIHIGKGVTIAKGATIEPYVYIGDGCKIGPSAFVRSGSVLSQGSVVGHSSEIKNTLLGKGVTLSHFNYVGDSIIGEQTHFGAGAKVCNLLLRKKHVRITTSSGEIVTSLCKCGAIMGNNIEVGANSIINPGVTIASETTIPPLSNVVRHHKNMM